VERLKAEIKKGGGSGVEITITTRDRSGLGQLSTGQHVSSTGLHKAVLYEGLVYDNLNPEGVPYEQWKADLWPLSGNLTDIVETREPF